MSEKMREEFQAWWLDGNQAALRQSCAMGWGFYIWQASRGSMVIELPAASSLMGRMYGAHAVKAIEAAGVKVKTVVSANL